MIENFLSYNKQSKPTTILTLLCLNINKQIMELINYSKEILSIVLSSDKKQGWRILECSVIFQDYDESVYIFFNNSLKE